MIKKINRNIQIAQEIQKKIAIILQRVIKDPRIDMVSISNVKLSKDLKYSKIYITFLKDSFEKDKFEKIKEKIKIINKASKFIRTLLYKSMSMRFIPELVFLYDDYWTNYIHISKLVSSITKNNKTNL
ncbi:Ribosome-binding factor A [Candidatus Providencia siddallii]|uniref:Ribosome-binding factor A n=1 Tax=Candidatus Providencia siddallii TaxID=1715285 RepID=A0A0M6W888_9GAMM|nr:Ribosome-binding factor A [Candidatus Providencia siddallii]